jgi:hypothetical protein
VNDDLHDATWFFRHNISYCHLHSNNLHGHSAFLASWYENYARRKSVQTPKNAECPSKVPCQSQKVSLTYSKICFHEPYTNHISFY